jgi:hypothetical protein
MIGGPSGRGLFAFHKSHYICQAGDVCNPAEQQHLIWHVGVQYDKAATEATADGAEVAEAEVDFDDEATLLLKALSAQDATVRARLKGATLESQTSCCIM